MKKIPKILSILIVSFFAIFILEGFGPDFSWQDSLSHLVLTLVILAITIFTWKKPQIGGWIFIALGLFYFFSSGGHDMISIAIFSLLPFLTGLLFIIK